MRSNIVETLVGLGVLLSALGLLAYAYVYNKHTSQTGYMLKAQFSRVDGLVQGSDIKVGGIKVGKVADQSLDPETFMAIVTLDMAPHVHLPKDSSITVSSESLLGGKFLDITPGGDMDTLQNGDTIEHTQSAVNMESLIGQLIFSKGNEKSA